MSVLSSKSDSKTIAISDILSARGINGAYSTLVEPALLFSSSWSLHPFVSCLSPCSHFGPGTNLSCQLEGED